MPCCRGKHEELGLIPNTVGCASVTQCWGQSQEDSRACWPASLTETKSFRFNERPCLKRKELQKTPSVDLQPTHRAQPNTKHTQPSTHPTNTLGASEKSFSILIYLQLKSSLTLQFFYLIYIDYMGQVLASGDCSKHSPDRLSLKSEIGQNCNIQDETPCFKCKYK